MTAGMSPERWQRITRIFHAARVRPPAERDQVVADACGGDAALRRDVEAMLAADAAAGRFGEEPLPGMLEASAEPALAPGARVGPFEIRALLGVGGMGEVYRARDPRLGRDVAIKILPRGFAADSERLTRFRREARVLASLNHPHIAAIYDLETLAEVDHLILELVEGEPLRGPLPVGVALEYGRQIAEALATAHAKGIVHRDLKPGNVKVTPDGCVKVLDFGLAHEAWSAEPTAAALVGSPAYMSPEQTRGDRVDGRADIWAFGCLLYELLAGAQAFQGASLSATIDAVQRREPDWRLLPRSTPAAVRRLLSRCLEKDPDRRPASFREVHRIILRIQHGTGRRRLVGVAAAVVVLLTAAVLVAAQRRATHAQWARNVAIPQIMQLAGSDEYARAFALALDVERRVPDDPVLATLWPRFSAPVSLVTDPEGADVYVRAYDAAAGEPWRHIGRTPLQAAPVPLGVFRFRVEKNGHDPLALAAPNPSTLLGNATNRLAAPVVIRLPVEGAAAGMVPIPGGAFPVSLNAFSTTDPISLEPYLIDRYEVTNARFHSFVAAGGYARAEYWDGLGVEVDGETSWQAAVGRFRDATGAPGPATWTHGSYPDGAGDHPVGGVSWYEAAAYCRYRGAALPTVYHWRRAALSPDEMFAPLAPAIIASSNFGSLGPARVGTFHGVGPFGTYDMAGNVREWSWNEAQPGVRWIQGGSWSDLPYMLVVPDRAPASDRSPTNGFRCAKYGTAPIPDRLLNPIVRTLRDNRTAAAVSEETFEIFRRQLAPVGAPLLDRIDFTETTNPDWTKQKISFETGYQEGRTAAYLFLPNGVTPPFQTVVYFPGRSSFMGRLSSDTLQPEFLDFVVKSGRALVWPVYKGSYERWIPTAAPSAEVRRLLFDWRQDLARVLDALALRPDIDAGRIAYLGLSYGATAPLPLLALEDRLAAAILLSAGLGALPGSPESDSLNYVSRIQIPVLLISGGQDYVFPLETSARPLFERLGTPADRKRHVVFDAGHMLFPRRLMEQEVLGWLDRYLGSVR